MRRLDKRWTKQWSGGNFKRKKRVPSSPSLTMAPYEAPSWAVTQDSEEQDTSENAGLSVEQCGE